MDNRIDLRIKELARDQKVSCTDAFTAVEDLGISPEELGLFLDRNGYKLTECQLGLFGYDEEKGKAEEVSSFPDIEREIKKNLDQGKLPCVTAWAAADRFGIERKLIAALCDSLGIKISKCQLGAFG